MNVQGRVRMTPPPMARWEAGVVTTAKSKQFWVTFEGVLKVRHCRCLVFPPPSRLRLQDTAFALCFHCLSSLIHCLCVVCVSTAFTAKTPSLPCVFHRLRG